MLRELLTQKLLFTSHLDHPLPTNNRKAKLEKNTEFLLACQLQQLCFIDGYVYIGNRSHSDILAFITFIGEEVSLKEYEPSAAGLVQSVTERFAEDVSLDKLMTDLIESDKQHWP